LRALFKDKRGNKRGTPTFNILFTQMN